MFDLSAQVVDAEGNALTAQQIADGAVVAGIALAWTEQLAGDYDQNGEVNASDLTPISVYWNESLSYDAPALHGGFALWPVGDPADDGSARVPAGVSGSASAPACADGVGAGLVPARQISLAG